MLRATLLGSGTLANAGVRNGDSIVVLAAPRPLPPPAPDRTTVSVETQSPECCCVHIFDVQDASGKHASTMQASFLFQRSRIKQYCRCGMADSI